SVGVGLDRDLGAVTVERHNAQDVATNQDAVALAHRHPSNALAVDEGAVRRTQVFDLDTSLSQLQTSVLARDHLLDQHHVQITGPPNEYLAVLFQRELPALVFSGNET